MIKKKFSKIMSVALALLMIMTTIPATVFADTPDLKEKTKNYTVDRYLYGEMEGSSVEFDPSIWNDNQGFDIPFIYTEPDSNGKYIAPETEAFRVKDENGEIMKDENGQPIVSYCLQMGLDAPTSTQMTYEAVDLDEAILRVLYAGYPNNLKNIEGYTEAEFEWATAIALRIVNGKKYEKTTGEENGDNPIRLDQFDFSGDLDCGKNITLRYSEGRYYDSLYNKNHDIIYTTYLDNYLAARENAVNALANNIVTIYKRDFDTESLPDFLTADEEGNISFVPEQWAAAYDWIMLNADSNTDIDNCRTYVLGCCPEDAEGAAENDTVAYIQGKAEELYAEKKAYGEKMYNLVEALVGYATDETIEIPSLELDASGAEDKVLPAGEHEFMVGPYVATLTPESDAELVVSVEGVTGTTIVDEDGDALTPGFGDAFYVKGTTDEEVELVITAYAKGLDVLTNVAYKEKNHEEGENYKQTMYVEETVTLNAEAKTKVSLTPLFDVVLTKTDLTSEEPVPGAIIEIRDAEGNEINGSPFTTDDEGLISISGIPAGTYTFKETVAPHGYIQNEDEFSFTIDEEGNVTGTTEFTNEKITADVTITKTDLVSGEPVPGAIIEIRDAEGNEIEGSPFTTDDNGEILVEKLLPGEYTFKETVAPDGYILNEAECTFTITDEGEIEGVTELTNEPASVVISKVDVVDGTPLPGAVIEILDANGEPIDGSPFTTDEEGQIVLYKLPAGTYTFHETVAPGGYIKSDETAEFTVNEDGTVEGKTTLENAPNTTVLTKTDMVSGRPVAGATIEILDADGNPVEGSPFVTGEDGTIEIAKLPAGTYTFHETVAPAGYILSDETAEFTVKEDGTVEGQTILKNAPTQVVLTKVDMVDGTPIPGATIEILDAKGEVVISGPTNEKGEFKVNSLPAGTYKFHEIVAPEGYVLSDEMCEFTIAEDGKVEGKTTLENEKVEVVITKTDVVDGKPVPGATIEVRNSEDKVVFSGKTDDNGQITIVLLPDGEYKFKETVAPDGYVLSSDECTFVLKDGKVSGKTTLTNAPTSVTIVKTEEGTGAALEGAKYEFKSGNTVIATETTDKDGKITLTKLPAGTYTFKEVEAPKGFAVDNTSYTFTIAPDGKVSGTTHVSDAKISVTFYKRDLTTGQVLQGATFQIKDENGNDVISATTDANGKITVSRLPAGKYILKETTAPKGYQLNNTEYTFTVNPDGTVEGTTTIYNKKEASPVPEDSSTQSTTQTTTSKTTDDGKGPQKTDTGDTTNNTGARVLFLGLAAVAAGAAVVVSRRKKEEDDE